MRVVRLAYVLLLPPLMACVFIGCATAPTPTESDETTAAEPRARAADLPAGPLEIDITNVLGQKLKARVDLLGLADLPPKTLEVPEGQLETRVPVGAYRAYVHVYDRGVPVLVEVRDIEVTESKPTYLLVNLLEGASRALGVRDFDFDGDLAIDRVELAAGTNPESAIEIPGRPPLPFPNPVLSEQGGWYCGDLHTHSSYGRGSERVGELVRRAERAGLDFLAITDRNTMAALHDPDFHSEKVVLLPAMEWGNDERGVALALGPRTLPDPPSTMPRAQAECIRVQAQGGVFAVAHPCFPTAPWRWGLSYVNAVETWCREWGSVPPMTLEQLGPDEKTREDGRLVHSIAAAAALADLAETGANRQAVHYYDLELVRGLMACAIGGSNSASPKVPLGQPVTYVYANEKSVHGILEGLRFGRTFVSSSKDGPRILMHVDVLRDKAVDVGIGGVIPLNVDCMFEVTVFDAEGCKLEVLLNGRPILAKAIEGSPYVQRFEQHPTDYGAYRARVISAPDDPGEMLGSLEVHAMTSPVYSADITQELLWRNPDLDPSKTWVRVQKEGVPEVALPENAPPLNEYRPSPRSR